MDFLPQTVADGIRVFLIIGFVVLAITLPVAIRMHAKGGRRTDSRILAACIWSVFAAGVIAVSKRFGAPLYWDLTLVRLLVTFLGFWYVVRNFRFGRRDRRAGDPTSRREYVGVERTSTTGMVDSAGVAYRRRKRDQGGER